MKMFKIEIDGNALFNKIIWIIIASAITFSAKKFNDMSNDISSLNRTMIEVVAGQKQDRKTIDDHEYRIRNLEKPPTHAPVRGY